MRPAYFNVTTVIDPSGIAAAQKPAAAGALSLNGTLISDGKWVAADDSGKKLSIVSNANDSTVSFTIIGEDVDGKAITEVLAGPNSGTTASVYYYKRIDRITANSATAGTITVGFSGLAETHTHMVNFKSQNFKAAVAGIVSGTINYTVQHTFDDIQSGTWHADTGTWFPNDSASLVAATANANGNYAYPPIACRMKINSASTGSTAQFVVIVPF